MVDLVTLNLAKQYTDQALERFLYDEAIVPDANGIKDITEIVKYRIDHSPQDTVIYLSKGSYLLALPMNYILEKKVTFIGESKEETTLVIRNTIYLGDTGGATGTGILTPNKDSSEFKHCSLTLKNIKITLDPSIDARDFFIVSCMDLLYLENCEFDGGMGRVLHAFYGNEKKNYPLCGSVIIKNCHFHNIANGAVQIAGAGKDFICENTIFEDFGHNRIQQVKGISLGQTSALDANGEEINSSLLRRWDVVLVTNCIFRNFAAAITFDNDMSGVQAARAMAQKVIYTNNVVEGVGSGYTVNNLSNYLSNHLSEHSELIRSKIGEWAVNNGKIQSLEEVDSFINSNLFIRGYGNDKEGLYVKADRYIIDGNHLINCSGGDGNIVAKASGYGVISNNIIQSIGTAMYIRGRTDINGNTIEIDNSRDDDSKAALLYALKAISGDSSLPPEEAVCLTSDTYNDYGDGEVDFNGNKLIVNNTERCFKLEFKGNIIQNNDIRLGRVGIMVLATNNIATPLYFLNNRVDYPFNYAGISSGWLFNLNSVQENNIRFYIEGNTFTGCLPAFVYIGSTKLTSIYVNRNSFISNGTVYTRTSTTDTNHNKSLPPLFSLKALTEGSVLTFNNNTVKFYAEYKSWNSTSKEYQYGPADVEAFVTCPKNVKIELLSNNIEGLCFGKKEKVSGNTNITWTPKTFFDFTTSISNPSRKISYYSKDYQTGAQETSSIEIETPSVYNNIFRFIPGGTAVLNEISDTANLILDN